MDTTQDQRPLPEILGWKLETESWPEVNWGGPGDQPYKQCTRDYYEAPDGGEREPTVDDMLAWLVATTGWICVDYTGYAVTRWHVDTPDHGRFTGLSLLEALQLAVRAVAA